MFGIIILEQFFFGRGEKAQNKIDEQVKILLKKHYTWAKNTFCTLGINKNILLIDALKAFFKEY
jgi:hypothetical protein